MQEGSARGPEGAPEATSRPPATEDGPVNSQTIPAAGEVLNDDSAALIVMLYLLLISVLSVGGIVLGSLVVVQYGLVVLLLSLLAMSGMLVVFATVYTVITQDAKLSRARKKIKKWHVRVKEEIIREMQNFRDDMAAYSQGHLLLTYDTDFVDNGDADATAEDRTKEFLETSDQFDSSKSEPKPAGHRPKSVLFRYALAPFVGRMKRRPRNSKIIPRRTKPWKRKQKTKDQAERQSEYSAPSIV